MRKLTGVSFPSRLALAGFALTAVAAGCATTQQVKVSDQSAQNACAFLGNTVCAELTPSEAPG
jgi:hypothetical protein